MTWEQASAKADKWFGYRFYLQEKMHGSDRFVIGRKQTTTRKNVWPAFEVQADSFESAFDKAKQFRLHVSP